MDDPEFLTALSSPSFLPSALAQYLFDNGYHETLLSLEREAGVTYDYASSPLPSSALSRSLARLHSILSTSPALSPTSTTTTTTSTSSSTSASSSSTPSYPGDAIFLPSGPSTPSTSLLSMEHTTTSTPPPPTPSSSECLQLCPHPANVIAAAWLPSSDSFVSGCADGVLRVWDFVSNDGGDRWRENSDRRAYDVVGSAIVLVAPRLQDGAVLVGGMNGSVEVVGGGRESWVVDGKHNHAVTHGGWAKDGSVFATCSYDETVALYYQPPGGDEGSWGVASVLTFKSNVEGVAFMDETTLVAAPRECACMTLYDLEAQTAVEYNMNPLGDDWVSYSVLNVAVPLENSHLVMATTDKARSLLFDVRARGGPVRTLFGPKNNGFSLPRGVLSPSDGLFYVTGEDKAISVFDVASARLVSKVASHPKTIRDLDLLPSSPLLLTASYDKNVGIWRL